MKYKLFLLSVVGWSAALVTACHNNDSAPAAAPPPPTSQTQSLDTAQVLVLAQQPSETSAPTAVNGGAVTLNDASETSAPIAVNAM